jgi:hypothetical protein
MSARYVIGPLIGVARLGNSPEVTFLAKIALEMPSYLAGIG